MSDAQRLMELTENEVNAVLISNVGGVIKGNAATDAVEKATSDLLEEAWPDVAWSIRHDKQDALQEGGGGPSTGDIFLMVSSFAILAGVMLIINIYAMLAEERRTEMGIMRAIAFSRQQLVMTFAYEGFVYSAIASVIGVIIGAALGALIVSGLSSLDDVPLTIKPSTLLLSGSAGLLISFITAFVTSIRISRLNIVMAIRNLSEPEGSGPGRWQLISLRGCVRSVICLDNETQSISQRFDRCPVGGTGATAPTSQTRWTPPQREHARGNQWNLVCVARWHTVAHDSS